jgi:2-oxoglutarate ferredoxin oxidoreductase subunit alpha/2-oxoisovalerate ferredoxin oxidoreductase alpha subunit
VVVEASSGQLEDELRLALSHEGILHGRGSVEHVRRQGGVLPSTSEIVEHVMLGLWAPAREGARA